MKNQYRGNSLVRKLVLLCDFAILNFILAIYQIFFSEITPDFFDAATKITVFVANVSLCIGEYCFSSIIHRRKVPYSVVIKRTFNLALLTASLFFFFVRLICDGGGFFQFYIVFGITFYLVLLLSRVCELSVLKHYRAKGHNRRTAVFIGNDPAILEMYALMTEDPSAGYFVKGYYADSDIKNAPKTFKRLGGMKDINEVLDSTLNNTIKGISISTEEIFCCLSHDYSEFIIKLIKYCDKNVIHFYYLPRQFGEYQLHLDSRSFMGKTVYSNHAEPLSNIGNRIMKRAFDIVVSSLICLCMLPFLPIIAIIIKLQSPGPLFFKQARTGLNGESFYCYKFRSMHVNNEADTAQATKDDPRKFAFGNFMRKTNIDEFPQFFNVLKGDMSIVGPRPHMLHHTEVYGKLIDKYMVRHFSKPGITGWAQVTGFRGETKELWQMEERIKRDIWYIENWTFWLDLRIIYLTAKSIFFPDKHAY